MLKALELNGFKSFVDKTRFEFPSGVTVVVGPNGSGKSNIVDAIKWVLGAQSVKSLRGREMADVIFNGSSARRPMNSAEATLIFENSSRLLAVDTPDVAITRRVYRSGEGEYLINHQPCRLRDIRDLFVGTGIATEAYSVIEQGKVDVMLQSSPRDRRVIFEEAAGISRFKAKKLEAMRRLERVDQNLLRLSDIVDEVESRLRSVRMQATKAQRFRELSDRLQELRTHVGWNDWRALTDQIDVLEASLAKLREERDRLSARADALESDALALETQARQIDQSIRESEASLAENRERIAVREASIEHDRRRLRDLEEETGRNRRQLAATQLRTGDLHQQLDETSEAVAQADADFTRIREIVQRDQAELGELTTRRDALLAENDLRHSEHLACLQTAAELGKQSSSLQSQAAAAQQATERCGQQLAELSTARQEIDEELQACRATKDELEDQYKKADQQLREARGVLSEARRMFSAATKQLTELQRKFAGARERADVLEDLERRQEGVAAGVRQTMLTARENPSGPYGQVMGMVADLVQVQVNTARLIEIALGDKAQSLVVSGGDRLLTYLKQHPDAQKLRVQFLLMDAPSTGAEVESELLSAEPGVLGPALQFVDVAGQYAPLIRRLLGDTWIVQDLATAISLSRGKGRGFNFVTSSGEWMGADGSLVVGPRQSSTGLISRRSELRSLAEQIAGLSIQIAELETTANALEAQISAQEQEVQQSADRHAALSENLASRRLQTASAEERLEQIERRQATLSEEQAAAQSQIEVARAELARLRGQADENEARRAELEKQLAHDRRTLDALSAQRAELQERATGHHVELAKSEQRLDTLQNHMQRLERDHQERDDVRAELSRQLQETLSRVKHSERNILSAQSEIAELYLLKEQWAAETVDFIEHRDACREKRTEFETEARECRHKQRGLEKGFHEKELSVGQLLHERTTLADRLREDYGIEISSAPEAVSEDEQRERDQIEQEIADLRGKLQKIGGVNLEALDELEELESRHSSLHEQFTDLTKAKATLEQIIERINADSRRLFAETLDVVRGHFQSLFRKLFGGGQADIILDDGEESDILESGIEIVARPPGKEPSSISLLSGGEKTLTCVALLLSIFRSRPSPFCVLDEVNAALDESNTERFIGVITEFLSSTQFIVVTHKKKTMTAADTLYGVTMQESGISRRVSVRFEDVRDGGHIDPAVIQSEATDQASDDETQAA